jgi:hypothetical protein
MMQGTPAPPFEPTVGFIIAACLGALPILGVMVWGAVRILGPLTSALARRLGGGSDLLGEDVRLEIHEMQHRIESLEADLASAQERLDFAERLLSQQRQPNHLPGAH